MQLKANKSKANKSKEQQIKTKKISFLFLCPTRINLGRTYFHKEKSKFT